MLKGDLIVVLVGASRPRSGLSTRRDRIRNSRKLISVGEAEKALLTALRLILVEWRDAIAANSARNRRTSSS